MEEQKILLSEQIEKAKEELNKLKPGTEEYKRQNDALVALVNSLTQIYVNESNAKAEEGRKKHNRRFLIITAAGTIVVPSIAVLLQFLVNKDIIRIEEFGSVAGHAAFNKNLLSVLNPFKRNVMM